MTLRAKHNPRGISKLLALLLLSVLCLAASVLGLTHGAVNLTLAEIMAVFWSQWDPSALQDASLSTIIFDIRLPRVLLGMLIGAALAMNGCVTQALFRNPLADPSLLGVNAGCALGAALMIVLAGRITHLFPWFASPYGVSLAAFIGGMLTTYGVVQLGRKNAKLLATSLLLAGIAINSLAGAAIGFLTYMAQEDELRNLTFWSLGSLGGAHWEQITISLVFLGPALLILPTLGKKLNIMMLGEREARHLGVAVEGVKKGALLLVVLATGAAVATCGMIGFVSLVAPHILRLGFGPDHVFLIPGSALLGALLLVVADTFARSLAAPTELPIGLLTALLGAPTFLWLLVKEQNGGTHV